MVRSKPSSCAGCLLYNAGSDFSQPEGSGSLGVALIGEASGENEARDQLPFRNYAPAGAVLERTLRRLGFSRDQFAVSNVLRCRPFNNELSGTSYEFNVIQQCQSNLLNFFRKFRPRVAVALGNIPFRTLTGISGEKRTISHMRGYVFRALPEFCEAAGCELLVVPTFHPSFLRRGAIHLTGVLARDIQRAVNIRAGKDNSYILDFPEDKDAQAVAAWLQKHKLNYTLHPSLRDLDQFCRDVKAQSDAWRALSPDMRAASLLALAYDLETVESADLDEDASDGFNDTQIRLWQASIAPGHAIAAPWKQPFIQAFRWLLKLPLPKIGHNIWLFDDKVLKAVSKRDFADVNYFIPQDQRLGHDTLQMFHYWQPDLPAHLQFAASFSQFPIPWKHLSGTNLELYGCFDVDADQRLYHTMRNTMQDRKMWQEGSTGGYVNQVEHLRPILADMEDRGLPVDNERRLALDAEFDKAYTEVCIELDKRFPSEARKITPATGYAGVPPRVKELLEQITLTVALPVEGKQTKKALAEASKVAFERRYANITADELAAIKAISFEDPPTKDDDGILIPGEKFYFDLRSFGQIMVDASLNARTEGIQKWCRVYEFSPNSPHQLKSYMKVKGHKVPTNKDAKETTSKKEIERLAARHKDDFYTKVIECRELNKARSTYIDGYKPHADGRVRTTFTFATGTGQLSSRNPNVQNTIKHGKLAKAIRSMIHSADGKLLVEWDFKAYHVLTTGYCARDKDYMRFARLDMHSFVAGHFNKDWDAFKLFNADDAELAERFAWFKSDPTRKFIRDKKAKPTILGVGFGLGDKKLYEMNLESFSSLKEAMAFKRVLKELFPRVFAWQDEIRDLAHRQGFLRNEFGAIRWFYEVYKPNGQGGWTGGEQSEEAIAFLPASLAFGNIRECMKEIDRRGLAAKWEQVNTVHDSLLYLVDPKRMDEHCADLYPVLTAPSKVLIDPMVAPGGLVVDCECSAGLDWGVLKGVELSKSLLAGNQLTPA